MIGKNRIPMYSQESRGENGMQGLCYNVDQTAAQFVSCANGSSFLSGADRHPKKSLQIYEPMGAILMQTTTLAKTI